MAEEGSSVDKYDIQSDLPSLDWELNLVLDEISQEMTEEDVDRMKNFCAGEEGIPTGVLNTITNGLTFFKILRRQNYLDRRNLLYLQAMLWNLGKKRRTLYQKLSEFAKRCELEPLNFFTSEEPIMEGFQYVHFHVSGTDTSIRNISRLQALVSKLVRVPLHLVHLDGVKPYRSIIITFRIPVDVVQALTNLTPEEKGLLQNEGIDSFFIGKEEVRVANEKSDIPARLSERDEVVKLMNRNRTLEKEVESHLLDISEEERKVEKLKIDLQQMNDTFREVLTIVMDSRQVQMPIDFDKETVLAAKIKEFDGKYPRCSHELHELLKVQSVVVQQAEESKWSKYINKMVTECEELYRQLHSDLYGLHLQCETDPDHSLNAYLPSEPSTPGHSMSSCVSGQDEVLREISMRLNDEERVAFRGSILLSEEEENLLKKNQQEFLGLIIGKEPLPEGKDLKQYLIDKLESCGSSDVEYVTHCFDATTSTTNEDNVEYHDLQPTIMSTPKTGKGTLERSKSDIFPKHFPGSYTVDDLYMRLMAFQDVIPVLLNQLPASARCKHRTLRMQSTPEVLLHGNV